MKSVKGEVERYPTVGEAVLMKVETMPRGSWKMARVVSLLPSETDDIHRAAKLKLSSGKLVKRPFKLLYPLELLENQ